MNLDLEYLFYQGKLSHEHFLCSCAFEDLMGEPMVGDMILLPIGADIVDQELYVIKQRVIGDEHIEFMCELYNWED